MNVEQARFNMIEQQIRPWDVLDSHVLDLLAAVRREDFVPAAHRQLAFADLQIPLKPGPQAVALGQVMLEPRVEARMLQDLRVGKHEKVLEVGTGSGFMAALLGHRAQRVLTLEIDPALAETAHANLQRAGVLNVEVRLADGASTDLSADGPFDAIVLSGSVAQVPEHQRLEHPQDPRARLAEGREASDAAVAVVLHLHPQEPEGDLSRRLEALVRMTTLAEVAETLGIGAHLTLARGEHEGGGRDKPNILADALEALIGALYLDGGLEPARNFVLRHWSERASSAQPAPRDPKMALQEWAQAQGIGLPRYAASAVGGPDHAPSFEATVTLATLGETSGTGGSKRAAEKAAAEAMLQKVVGR